MRVLTPIVLFLVLGLSAYKIMCYSRLNASLNKLWQQLVKTVKDVWLFVLLMMVVIVVFTVLFEVLNVEFWAGDEDD